MVELHKGWEFQISVSTHRKQMGEDRHEKGSYYRNA